VGRHLGDELLVSMRVTRTRAWLVVALGLAVVALVVYVARDLGAAPERGADRVRATARVLSARPPLRKTIRRDPAARELPRRLTVLDREPEAIPPPPPGTHAPATATEKPPPFTQDEFVERRENGIAVVDTQIERKRTQLADAERAGDNDARQRAEVRLARLLVLREVRVEQLDEARRGELRPEGYGQGE
jgi:hypothetical protein